MPTSTQLHSLRSALQLLPVEWTVWALDPRGVVVALEGPGIAQVVTETMVGRSVWEAFAGENPVLVFAHRVLRGPEHAALTVRGRHLLVAGAPNAEGGAVGMALALPRDAVAPDAGVPREVVELARPIREIGAQAGDLLVWNPDRPGKVGLYRELEMEELPPPVAERLDLTGRSPAAGAPPARAPVGRAPRRRASAAHLRLVP